MTLRARLILTIGGTAVLLVLPALYAAQQLSHLRDIASGTRNVHGAAYLAMGRYQARLTELDRVQRALIVEPTAETSARRDSALQAARGQLTELATTGYRDAARRAGIYLDSIETAIARIDGLIVAGDAEASTDEYDLVKPLYVQSDEVLRSIGAEIDERSAADLREAGRISAAAMSTTLVALLAALFIAILLGTWATHTVVTPILRLRRATAAVADGDFVVADALDYDRNDEIGDLSRSFAAMTHRLAELDQMKADFMSIATHELKTPINVISGYAELMQEELYGPLTAKQMDALVSVQEQSRNLTQLVNQLLDISRLEAGGLRLEIRPLAVADLLDRLRRTFEGLASRQNIAFDVTLDPGAPTTIPGDADRLRDQVFGNLLSNALKFTPEGGMVRVRARGHGDRLVVEVSDSGPGIPSDLLPHVFDKYFQIGEQARSKGAGLGLTIAHDVVRAHGGTITVESVEGTGTTFRISLPTGATRAPAAGRRALAAAADRADR